MHGGEIQGKIGTKFWSPFPSGVTHNKLNSPKKLWQHLWNVTYQGSQALNAQGFYLGMTDNSAWHITKSQNARRKASVQNKPYCLYKKSRHSKPLLPVNDGNPPEIWVSRHQGQPCKMLSKQSSQACYVYPFLHCYCGLFSYFFLCVKVHKT